MLREDERRKLVAAKARLDMRSGRATLGSDSDEALRVLIELELRRAEPVDLPGAVIEDMRRNPSMPLETALNRARLETASEPVMPLRTDENTVHHAVDSLGRLATEIVMPNGFHRTGEDCPACGGSGIETVRKVPRRPCTACFGSGMEIVPDE